MKKQVWMFVMALLLMAPGFSFAETDVADYTKGGSAEMLAGAVNSREPIENLAKGSERGARCVMNSVKGFSFRVRFFKPMQISRMELVPWKSDKNDSAKDLLITTSSGKKIDFTLKDDGWDSHWKTPAQPQAVPISDTCEWIQVDILNTYEKGAAWGGLYAVKAFTDEDLSAYFKVDYNYDKPHYVMRTVYETDAAKPADTKVTIGEPTLETGYPRLVWGAEDVAYYKKMIAENKFAKKAWNELLDACENYMAKGYTIPSVEENDNTKTTLHEQNADQITALATAHLLSGNKKPEYARRAIEILGKYAEIYEKYGPTKNPQMNHDYSKATWQRLNESMWGMRLAIGYDFLMNDPATFSPEEAKKIKDRLLIPIASEIARGNIFDALTNWSAYDCAAVYMIGRLFDDQHFINIGKYGWAGTPGGKPGAGLISKIRDGIDTQGLWAEPSPGYVHMAVAAMETSCEVAWHAGEDWYSIGGGNMQRLLASSGMLATPGGFVPALGDSGRVPIEEDYYTPHIETAASRIQDKSELVRLLAMRKTFTLKFRYQTILPSRDFNMYSASEAKPMQSGFFPGLGYAIARDGSGADGKYLLFDVNCAHSHGHPDKLQILYYNLGNFILPDQGIVFYDKPDYLNWYSRTPVHNTISVNSLNMKKDQPVLEIFGSAGQMHVFAGAAPTAYPGCSLQRTTLLLGGTVLDVFRAGAFYTADFDYNLHFAGGQAIAAPPAEEGKFFNNLPFSMLTGQKKHQTGDTALFTWDYGKNGKVNYLTETVNSTVFSGEGIVPVANPDDFVVVRRKNASDYFSAIDAYTGAPRVVSLRSLPVKNKDLFAGEIKYTDGSTGLLALNFAADIKQAVTDGDLSLQGRLAYSETDASGKLVRAIYIGEGGKAVMGNRMNIAASGSCMVFVDRYADGFYTVQNLNNRGAADVAIELPLDLPAGARLHQTGDTGRWLGNGSTLSVSKAASGITVQLNGFNRVEITAGDRSVAQIEEDKRQAQIAQEKAAFRKQMAARIDQLSDLYKKAAAARPEKVEIIIQAEQFASQSGGTMKTGSGRPGTWPAGSGYTTGWDGKDHSVTWNFTAPQSGYYVLTFKYCTENPAARMFAIDGQPLPAAVEELSFPQTGGFSRAEDQWELGVVADPDLKVPYPLWIEKGNHTLTINNVRGSMNLDYIALRDYRLPATRASIESDDKSPQAEPDFAALRRLYLGE